MSPGQTAIDELASAVPPDHFLGSYHALHRPLYFSFSGSAPVKSATPCGDSGRIITKKARICQPRSAKILNMDLSLRVLDENLDVLFDHCS
jgi:hypothetical protein